MKKILLVFLRVFIYLRRGEGITKAVAVHLYAADTTKQNKTLTLALLLEAILLTQ
jgi:hypothetical protein